MLVPGGGNASAAILAGARRSRCSASIAWFAVRLYREHRADIYGSGTATARSSTASAGLATLTLTATDRLWETGAGHDRLVRADGARRLRRVLRLPRVARSTEPRLRAASRSCAALTSDAHAMSVTRCCEPAAHASRPLRQTARRPSSSSPCCRSSAARRAAVAGAARRRDGLAERRRRACRRACGAVGADPLAAARAVLPARFERGCACGRERDGAVARRAARPGRARRRRRSAPVDGAGPLRGAAVSRARARERSGGRRARRAAAADRRGRARRSCRRWRRASPPSWPTTRRRAARSRSRRGATARRRRGRRVPGWSRARGAGRGAREPRARAARAAVAACPGSASGWPATATARRGAAT